MQKWEQNLTWTLDLLVSSNSVLFPFFFFPFPVPRFSTMAINQTHASFKKNSRVVLYFLTNGPRR